jgi:hypothetical protein
MGVWADCFGAGTDNGINMSHVQSQILAHVKSLLTGLATTGVKVYRGAVHPETPASMPGLCVALGNETTAGGTLDATTKAVELLIKVFVAGDDFDISAQSMAEIEAALYGSFSEGGYFSGLALSVVYEGAIRTYKDSAAFRHTVRDIVYKVEYQTADGSAETAII